MHVILIAPVSAERVAQIAAVDARLQVEQAWELFAPELVAEWPAQTVEWYLPPRFRDVTDSAEQRTRRDALLSGADVIALTFRTPPACGLALRGCGSCTSSRPVCPT